MLKTHIYLVYALEYSVCVESNGWYQMSPSNQDTPIIKSKSRHLNQYFYILNLEVCNVHIYNVHINMHYTAGLAFMLCTTIIPSTPTSQISNKMNKEMHLHLMNTAYDYVC